MKSNSTTFKSTLHSRLLPQSSQITKKDPDVIIDKVALIHTYAKKILMAQSFGKDVYYIPGGKRCGIESDTQTLGREIREELAVDVIPGSLKLYGVFEAQAHGRPPGIKVRMTCYTADFVGNPKASGEIARLAYYGYEQRSTIGPVDQIIFDDLRSKNLL